MSFDNELFQEEEDNTYQDTHFLSENYLFPVPIKKQESIIKFIQQTKQNKDSISTKDSENAQSWEYSNFLENQRKQLRAEYPLSTVNFKKSCISENLIKQEESICQYNQQQQQNQALKQTYPSQNESSSGISNTSEKSDKNEYIEIQEPNQYFLQIKGMGKWLDRLNEYQKIEDPDVLIKKIQEDNKKDGKSQFEQSDFINKYESYYKEFQSKISICQGHFDEQIYGKFNIPITVCHLHFFFTNSIYHMKKNMRNKNNSKQFFCICGQSLSQVGSFDYHIKNHLEQGQKAKNPSIYHLYQKPKQQNFDYFKKSVIEYLEGLEESNFSGNSNHQWHFLHLENALENFKNQKENQQIQLPMEIEE